MNQDPPFAIQLEPVEGCSLACSFCSLQVLRDNGADAEIGLHGKNSPPYRFADVAMFDRIGKEVARLGWNPRIEFAMHGEPTMHPRLEQCVSRIRFHLPRVSIMVTTNGSGLLKAGRFEELFAAGVNTIAIDDYDHASFCERALENVPTDVHVYHYPASKDASPHLRFHGQRVVVIADIAEAEDGTHLLSNQGGNVPLGRTDELPLQERCAKPFRELSIRWDGNVAVCCDDWKGEYQIANIMTTPLHQLWHHPRFDAARRILYKGDRGAMKPCKGCNVRTYRNGLLPDKLGKQTLAPPDRGCWEHATAAQAHGVYTIKIMKGEK
jgi:radical SAM protein with 4Fe4S-binding SPASM domain